MSSNTAALQNFHAGQIQEHNRSDNYDDIIDTPYPFSAKLQAPHERMPISERAAEFAPFAALTVYHETIDKVSANSADTAAPIIIDLIDDSTSTDPGSPSID